MSKLAAASRKIRRASLPHARIRAHEAFDPLWQSGKLTRSEAYEWLCAVMNKTSDMGHIGYFTLEECDELIEKVAERELQALRTSRG